MKKYNELLKESSNDIFIEGRKYIKEFNINETIINIRVIYFIATVLYFYFKFIYNSRYDRNLSDNLNKSLGDSSKYKVNIMNEVGWNAFAVLNFKTVYITKGLYDSLNPDERISVLLHEVGHIQELHSIKQMILSYIVPIIGASAITYTINLKKSNKEDKNNLKKFIWILPSTFILWLYLFSRPLYSRYHEYEADKFVSEKGFGKQLASAFHKFDIKFGHTKKSKDRSPIMKAIIKFFEFFSTHPSFEDRINKLLTYSENKKLSFEEIKEKVSKELKSKK